MTKPTEAPIEALARRHVSTGYGGAMDEVAISRLVEDITALLAAFQLSPAGERGKVVEECAKVADRVAENCQRALLALSAEAIVGRNAALAIAVAIRALSPPRPELSPAKERGKVVEECADVTVDIPFDFFATATGQEMLAFSLGVKSTKAAIRALSSPQPAEPVRPNAIESTQIIHQIRTMDESEAAKVALDWIEGLVEKKGFKNLPGCEIKNADGVISLWDRTHRPIAIVVLIRDDWNYTVATFCEIKHPFARSNTDEDLPSEDELAQVLHDNNYHPTPWDRAIEPYKGNALSDARAVLAFLTRRAADKGIAG